MTWVYVWTCLHVYRRYHFSLAPVLICTAVLFTVHDLSSNRTCLWYQHYSCSFKMHASLSIVCPIFDFLQCMMYCSTFSRHPHVSQRPPACLFIMCGIAFSLHLLNSKRDIVTSFFLFKFLDLILLLYPLAHLYAYLALARNIYWYIRSYNSSTHYVYVHVNNYTCIRVQNCIDIVKYVDIY